MAKQGAIVPASHIERAIFFIRGQKVMLDADLAVLYGVSRKSLSRLFGGITLVFQTIFCSN